MWAKGLIERDSNRLKLFPVDNRNAETLISVIQEHLTPGSTIYSDGWPAYNSLRSLGYKQYVVEQKFLNVLSMTEYLLGIVYLPRYSLFVTDCKAIRYFPCHFDCSGMLLCL